MEMMSGWARDGGGGVGTEVWVERRAGGVSWGSGSGGASGGSAMMPMGEKPGWEPR